MFGGVPVQYSKYGVPRDKSDTAHVLAGELRDNTDHLSDGLFERSEIVRVSQAMERKLFE